MPVPQLSTRSVVLAAGATTACLAYAYRRQLAACMESLLQQLQGGAALGGDDDDAVEVPEEFLDPISFAPMQDPVLLCGTGQVYCLRSLRSWLCMGSRTCPRTNMTMRDVEVVRLPSLRSRIAAWHEAHGLPPLPPLDPPPEVLREAGPEVSQLLVDLRSGDVYKRGVAAGAINDMLIVWGNEPPMPARQQVMEAILLDLVWLMRQGDSYGSGVAAAALAQYEAPEQVSYLAAVAAMPAVALLWSPHTYGQHSAARLLSNLARTNPLMPAVLVEGGAVGGLLRQLDLRHSFKYTRCSAASALWALCKCEEARMEVRQGDGVRLLKELVLQPEPVAEAEDGEFLVRYDRRDAAGCLLELGLTEEEAAVAPAVSMALLRQYKHCSHAWLRGEAEAPTEGYTAEQVAAGVPQLATGEAEQDDDEDEEGQGEEEEEEEEGWVTDGEEEEGGEDAGA